MSRAVVVVTDLDRATWSSRTHYYVDVLNFEAALMVECITGQSITGVVLDDLIRPPISAMTDTQPEHRRKSKGERKRSPWRLR